MSDRSNIGEDVEKILIPSTQVDEDSIFLQRDLTPYELDELMRARQLASTE